MPGTGWALCCHSCPRHYCFIPLNCWEPVPEGFGSSTRPPPRLAGGDVLDSASPTAAPPFLFLASGSSMTFCLQRGFHRSGNAWKALLWKIPWRQTSHVFPTQTVSPTPWSQLAGSCKGRASPPASRCKGQEPVASVKIFFFFLSRLSFSNTLLLNHNWKNPKLLIYKASPHTATNSHMLYLLSWTWSNFSENIKIIFFIFNLENWMFFNIHHHNLINF